MNNIQRTLEEARGTLQANIDILSKRTEEGTSPPDINGAKMFMRKRKAVRGLLKYARYLLNVTAHRGNDIALRDVVDFCDELLQREINIG